MIISLMVAYSKNYAIGKNNKLLWHLSDDLKNFKRITLNKTIIMGRKTFESIGFPLPKRTNIIVTRSENFQAEGCVVVNSIDDAINYASEHGAEEVIITGGSQIYEQTLNKIQRAYITEVNCNIEDADSFFPKVDFNRWRRIENFSHPKDSNNDFAWTFSIYEKMEQ